MAFMVRRICLKCCVLFQEVTSSIPEISESIIME